MVLWPVKGRHQAEEGVCTLTSFEGGEKGSLQVRGAFKLAAEIPRSADTLCNLQA